MVTAQENRTSLRIPELDGIRGIAIFLVLVWHYGAGLAQTQDRTITGFFVRALGFTWSGVDLFFVLSGFLIGGILLDNKEAVNYFKVFYFRRVCRIFPLYFAWLSLFIVLGWIFQSLASTFPFDEVFVDRIPRWSHATFTQNFLMAAYGDLGSRWLGVTWSLAIEEQFYLILPCMIRFLSSRRLLHTLVVLIVAAPIARTAFFFIHTNAGLPGYVLLPCRADALLLGVLCAYILRNETVRGYVTSHPRLLYVVFTGLLLTFGNLLLDSPPITTLAMTSYGYSLLALLYSCFLLIAVTERRGAISWIARNPVLRGLGVLAYGVYLFHQGISVLCHALILRQVPQVQTLMDMIVMLCALVVTIGMAFVSWTVFERPLVQFGHALKYARS